MFIRFSNIKRSFICSNFDLFRIILIAEMYSESSQTSKTELFCEKSKRFSAHIPLGFKYASE